MLSLSPHAVTVTRTLSLPLYTPSCTTALVQQQYACIQQHDDTTFAQASEYARLVVREQELLRALAPLLSGDSSAMGPLREARRLRQQKLKALARLEQARSATRLLQEAGRLLRHVKRTLEWARPRLAWIRGMHGASLRHIGSTAEGGCGDGWLLNCSTTAACCCLVLHFS